VRGHSDMPHAGYVGRRSTSLGRCHLESSLLERYPATVVYSVPPALPEALPYRTNMLLMYVGGNGLT